MSLEETQNQTQADFLRDFINKKIDEGFDWGNASKKRELKKQILEENPKLFPSKHALDSYFGKILTKQLVEKKKDPRDFGLKTKLPKIVGLGSDDMQANIKLETASTENTLPSQDQNKPQTPTTSPSQDAPRPWTDSIDADSVSASFSALFLTIKMAYPELESLTDEEKKSLGKLWLPAFKKYLTEMQAVVLIPLIATLGMFAPKIGKARKLAKEKKEAKQKSEEQK